MREAPIEERLVERVAELGGVAIKAESLMTGFPDRIIIGPAPIIAFAETKAPNGRVRPAQSYVHRRIFEPLGWTVYVPRSYEDVEQMLEEIYGSRYRPR